MAPLDAREMTAIPTVKGRALPTPAHGLSKVLKSWFKRSETPSPAAEPDDARFDDDATRQMMLSKRDIETEIVDAGTSKRFMDRVIAQWQALGEADPYWSNDTQDRFKAANLTDASIDAFYSEGSGVIGLIQAFESRSAVDVGNGTCMELGCGVGKHTHALARRFERVIGIDVSRAGLAVCDRQMERFGLRNVTTMALTMPSELSTCGAIDVFVCLSVLQHNPPPIQKQLIAQALSVLRPGGYALFQAPDYRQGYRFATEDFLTAADAAIDIHCLPKTEVLKLLATSGMTLLDFAPDATLGGLGSYTYFARKV